MFLAWVVVPALVISAVFAVLSCISVTAQPRDVRMQAAGITFVAAFCVNSLVNWLVMYAVTPDMSGANWGMNWLIVDLIITMVIGGAVTAGFDSNSRPSIEALSVFGLVFVIMLVRSGFNDNIPIGQNEVDQITAKLEVQFTDQALPETDPDHLGQVSEQVALDKIKGIMATAGDFNDRPLNSVLEVREANKQLVNGRVYWIVEFKFDSKRNARNIDLIIPIYGVVDAENINAAPEIRSKDASGNPFPMAYSPAHFGWHDLDRKLALEFNGTDVDDITLEVDDNWRPYYTASLNKPQVGTYMYLPTAAIVVDPVTGVITKYNTNEVPAWVDRIWSDEAVKALADHWGHYQSDKAPRKWPSCCGGFLKQEKNANREKVLGEPNLVYSDGENRGAVWQVALTTLSGSSTSSTRILLIDARTGHAVSYQVKGVTIENDVRDKIVDSQQVASEVKKEAVDLSLYSISGTPAWVGPLKTASGGNGGIVIVKAVSPTNTDVIIGNTLPEALLEFQKRVNSSAQAEISKNAVDKTVQGVLVESNVWNQAGNSLLYFTIDTAPGLQFYADISAVGTDIAFADEGDLVRITYLDTGATNSPHFVKTFVLDPPPLKEEEADSSSTTTSTTTSLVTTSS